MIGFVLAALTAAAHCPQLPLTPRTSWTYRAEVAWTRVDSDSVERKTILWTPSVEPGPGFVDEMRAMADAGVEEVHVMHHGADPVPWVRELGGVVPALHAL